MLHRAKRAGPPRRLRWPDELGLGELAVLAQALVEARPPG
jgi:hypothetical protein